MHRGQEKRGYIMPDISHYKWKVIDEITAYIYETEPYPDLSKIVQDVKALFPFSSSLTCLCSDADGGLSFFDFCSDDLPPDAVESYCNRYYHYDYLMWYSANPKPIVFRSRDIILEAALVESLFMKEWMQPLGLYYTMMVNIAADNHLYGNIVFYRSKEAPPFSDDEVALLKIINRHLSARFGSLYPNGIFYNPLQNFEFDFSSVYGLTPREQEILELVCRGTDRGALSSQLFISENTLKNYLSSIYHKIGIRSYSELLNKLRPSVSMIKAVGKKRQHPGSI